MSRLSCSFMCVRFLIGTVSRLSCSFMSVRLVIQYYVRFPTRQFYRSKCDITRLPVFGSFCKLLRNVVTETFAEPSANWEVSSNRILTGRPLGSFINVKLVIHYLMYSFRPTRAPNFQTVLQTSKEFCNKSIPVVFHNEHQ